MALPNRPKKIHLLGNGRHDEAVAAGTITPGMLIALNNAGKVIAHATSGGVAERNFAVEDALQGRTIEDNYVSGELVGFVNALVGDVVFAWLASGQNVVIGDLLQSGGDGTLIKRTGTNTVIGVALEALDIDGSDDENTRIRVRLV